MAERKGKLSYILESARFTKQLYAVFETANEMRGSADSEMSSQKLTTWLCEPRGRGSME